MAVCKKCGAEVSDGAKFCNECGEKIESSSEENKISSNNVYVPDVTLQEMFLKTSGRLNRKRYFKRSFALGALQMLIMGIMVTLSMVMYGYIPESVEIFCGIIGWLFMIPSYCLIVRRLHDINKDNKLAIASMVGGFLLLILIDPTDWDNALVLMIVSLIFCGVMAYFIFRDGTHGENKYGPDPLNR